MGRGRWWTVAAVVAALAALAAAGCGDDEAGAGDDGPLTVAEALEHEGRDAVTVEGLLLADQNGTYLCSALAESFPPQCGAPAVTVSGLSLTAIDGVSEEGQVRWREEPVQVTGRMLNGVLSVDGPPATVYGPGTD